jgi:hypothetical protein
MFGTPGSHEAGPGLKSIGKRPWPKFFVVFLNHDRQMLRQYLELAQDYSFHVLSNSLLSLCHSSSAPRIFRWGGGGDPEAIYNLILKIMLQKSCKYNITLSATAFIYIRIWLHVPWFSVSYLLAFSNFINLFFEIRMHQPSSVADFGWRGNHVKLLIS